MAACDWPRRARDPRSFNKRFLNAISHKAVLQVKASSETNQLQNRPRHTQLLYSNLFQINNTSTSRG